MTKESKVVRKYFGIAFERRGRVSDIIRLSY